MVPQNETKMYELGRLAGIREAIAVMRELAGDHGPYDEEFVDDVEAHIAIITRIPPPSGGEKAKCTCGPFPIARVIARCPVHAPKPDAEKP